MTQKSRVEGWFRTYLRGVLEPFDAIALANCDLVVEDGKQGFGVDGAYESHKNGERGRDLHLGMSVVMKYITFG